MRVAILPRCVMYTVITSKWSWEGSISSKVTEREEDKEKEKNDETERNTDEHSFQRYVTER